MGGFIDASESDYVSFNNYGWVKRDCSFIDSNPVYALCLFDCGDSPVTTQVSPTETPETPAPTPAPVQRFYYSVYSAFHCIFLY